MAINRKPSPTGDGRLDDDELAENKSDYNHLTKPEVIEWEEALHKSIGIREDEQKAIIKKTGGEAAHDERLKNDPDYKKKWDTHEERIRNEEKAFTAAQDWLKDRD